MPAGVAPKLIVADDVTASLMLIGTPTPRCAFINLTVAKDGKQTLPARSLDEHSLRSRISAYQDPTTRGA